LQLVHGERYQVEAEDNRLRQFSVAAARGLIFDRNGVPIVTNSAGYAAAAVPADLPKERETAILLALQELIGVPAGEMAAKIDERRQSNDPFTPLILKENIRQEKAF